MTTTVSWLGAEQALLHPETSRNNGKVGDHKRFQKKKASEYFRRSLLETRIKISVCWVGWMSGRHRVPVERGFHVWWCPAKSYADRSTAILQGNPTPAREVFFYRTQPLLFIFVFWFC